MSERKLHTARSLARPNFVVSDHKDDDYKDSNDSDFDDESDLSFDINHLVEKKSKTK